MKSIKHNVKKITSASSKTYKDDISVEEPLEIRVAKKSNASTFIQLAVTMRTPGDDAQLARGFLFTEGIIDEFSQIYDINQVDDNIISIVLSADVQWDEQQLKRNFYATSSCGVCGKANIESTKVDSHFLPWTDKTTFKIETLYGLPEKLRGNQEEFTSTGGIHACAVFDQDGKIHFLREDVGRHNAMDKLVGSLKSIPTTGMGVLLSGRASFELVQKCARIGVPLIAAIGSPSSLAIELAEEMGITLIGFLKKESFNIYTCEERVV